LATIEPVIVRLVLVAVARIRFEVVSSFATHAGGLLNTAVCKFITPLAAPPLPTVMRPELAFPINDGPEPNPDVIVGAVKPVEVAEIGPAN
jgi:hypothetical protein